MSNRLVRAMWSDQRPVHVIGVLEISQKQHHGRMQRHMDARMLYGWHKNIIMPLAPRNWKKWSWSSRSKHWGGWGTYCAWKMTGYRSKLCTGKWIRKPSGNQDEEELDRRHTLKTIGMAWEDVEQSATNCEDWRRSVAQCVYDTGWPKSKSKSGTTEA